MKTREEIKNIVLQMIKPMCFGGAMIPWDAVENLQLFAEVVEEVIEQDIYLRRELSDVGELYDISVYMEVSYGAKMPTVHVTYRIKPLYREVDKTIYNELAKTWNVNRVPFFSFDIDCVDLDFQKIMNSFSFNNIECTPVEIIQYNGHILVRCLHYMFGKESESTCKFYHRLYQEVYFGKDGLFNHYNSNE